MKNENPYEPSDVADDQPKNRQIVVISLLGVATGLSFLAGAIPWFLGDGRNLSLFLFFVSPVIAILIAAMQFGIVTVWQSMKALPIFIAIFVAGYVTFAATCSGTNMAFSMALMGVPYAIPSKLLAVMTTISTLLGGLVAFLLAKRFVKVENRSKSSAND